MVCFVCAKTSHRTPSVVMRARLRETTRYVDVILPQSYGRQTTVQEAKRLLSLSKLQVCLPVDRVRGKEFMTSISNLFESNSALTAFRSVEWASAWAHT